jgi:hypothetical protein
MAPCQVVIEQPWYHDLLLIWNGVVWLAASLIGLLWLAGKYTHRFWWRDGRDNQPRA